MNIQFKLNGHQIEVDVPYGLTLMEYLRKEGIFSIKRGCDHGECGSCTVLIDGKTQNACLILMHTVNHRNIETLEGLQSNELLQRIQNNFLQEGAIQCGYCTPGMILSAMALLQETSNPSEEEIRDALSGNYCRCTGYVKPIKAISKT